MVGRAPRRPARLSTGPRLRRYGQVSAQQGRAPLDRPLEAPINLKPMHHAFHGDDGHCVRLRHIFAWANRSWPVSAGRHRTVEHQPLAGARAYEETVFASSGRSRVRPWVGGADGFTDRRHICVHLRQCSSFPVFATYSPGDPDLHACANHKDVLDVIHRLVTTELRRYGREDKARIVPV